MKNRFQILPFKCNLQRYPEGSNAAGPGLTGAVAGEPTSVTVTPRDAFGNLVVSPGVLCQGVLVRTVGCSGSYSADRPLCIAAG